MNIVSMSGLIGSGKDTVAEYLINEHGYEKESFANSLKDAVAAVFGWDRAMLEGATIESRVIRERVDPWWANKLNMPHLTPRWVLQYWGTEVCRQGFDDQIWVASLEKRLLDHGHGKNIVISDARFVNEINMLKNIGATTVCVSRGDLPKWWDIASQAHNSKHAMDYMLTSGIHRSEWDWVGCDFDVVINNNKTLDDLYDIVDMAVLKSPALA
jgi:hypothetical protein